MLYLIISLPETVSLQHINRGMTHTLGKFEFYFLGSDVQDGESTDQRGSAHYTWEI